MDLHNTDDAVTRRIKAMNNRVNYLKTNDLYFYNQAVEEILDGARVRVRGREMGMYASYSYLGLVGHPRINEAAKKAVDKFGTGTHGVRTLAGTLTIHSELEETISNFKHTEGAITYSSGYATNLSVVSTLMGRGDYVFSDKLNHASIVDGCLMSGAEFRRFRHKVCSRTRLLTWQSLSLRIPSSAWTAISSISRRCSSYAGNTMPG
jgi:glycine C-acetyltransferase